MFDEITVSLRYGQILVESMGYRHFKVNRASLSTRLIEEFLTSATANLRTDCAEVCLG